MDFFVFWPWQPSYFLYRDAPWAMAAGAVSYRFIHWGLAPKICSSLHYVLLWSSVMVSVCYKERLLWWGVAAAPLIKVFEWTLKSNSININRIDHMSKGFGVLVLESSPETKSYKTTVVSYATCMLIGALMLASWSILLLAKVWNSRYWDPFPPKWHKCDYTSDEHVLSEVLVIRSWKLLQCLAFKSRANRLCKYEWANDSRWSACYRVNYFPFLSLKVSLIDFVGSVSHFLMFKNWELNWVPL